ncbi:MAG: glycosyltransferase family 39 protein [Pseudomonadota bacterium]
MSVLESRRTFFYLLWFTLLLKFAWAAWLPLTGDEVYFYIWAKNPSMGYYDHPPMVGWWLSLLLWFGDANWWLRLPAVLLGSGLSLGVYFILRDVVEERKAVLGALLLLLSPLGLLNVIVTTDTPLIFFSFLSAWVFYKAMQQGAWRWYLLSGLLLGLAFMAKYFAVLLGLSYGLYIIIYRRNRRDMLGLLWLFLAVLPFAALNVWWNYCHCWDNILFNAYNRHGGGGSHLVSYLLMLVYMLTPPLLWYSWRERRPLWLDLRGGGLFVFLGLVPLLLFLLLSLKARIGLHWVLAFYPFVFIVLASIFSSLALRRSLKFMMGFSLLHIAAVVVVLTLPHDYWKSKPSVYDGVLIGYYADEFIEQFDVQADGYHWATGSYVESGMLEYVSGKRFIVFGGGSKHGRHDDLLTDWRAFAGENIAVLVYKEQTANAYALYFKQASVVPFQVQQRNLYLLLGNGFRYELYRNGVLTQIRDRYYRYPDFLPAGQCYFNQRYFPGEGVLRLQQ